MTNKEKTIKELKEVLDSLDITNKYRLNLIRVIEYLQEERVSEDLGDYINKLSKQFPEVSFAKLSRIAVRVAKWQKQQDQSAIELAEDHAIFAGMEKMKKQMMTKSIEAVVSQVPCSNEIILYNPSSVDKYYLPQEMNKLGLNKGDKVKLIIIKED
jgi:hypothetical protein